jgi:hypothetical protein
MSQSQDETKRNLRTSKRILAVGLPLVIIVGAGIGYANWNQTGSGSGSAKAVSALASTVGGGSGAADLYPGGSGTLYFTLTNPNPYAVTFTSLTAAGAVTSDKTNCGAVDLTVNTLSLPAGGVRVPANTTSTPQAVSVAAAVTMPITADNACQGATFTVPVTVTGAASS